MLSSQAACVHHVHCGHRLPRIKLAGRSFHRSPWQLIVGTLTGSASKQPCLQGRVCPMKRQVCCCLVFQRRQISMWQLWRTRAPCRSSDKMRALRCGRGQTPYQPTHPPEAHPAANLMSHCGRFAASIHGRTSAPRLPLHSRPAARRSDLRNGQQDGRSAGHSAGTDAQAPAHRCRRAAGLERCPGRGCCRTSTVFSSGARPRQRHHLLPAPTESTHHGSAPLQLPGPPAITAPAA
jgi:hypothetical protein